MTHVGSAPGRKRQLVLESSDSEGDEFFVSMRQKDDAAASVGNAGAGSSQGANQLGEKVETVSSVKISGVKSQGAFSDKKKGNELDRSGSQPDAKKIRTEPVHGGGGGSGGSVPKDGTSGRMLPLGFPKWRFEKPEIRAGWVLDEKGGVEMKVSRSSKVKELVSSSVDERKQSESQKHDKRIPLKADQGNSVEQGRQEVIRVQGKSGVLKILPKNNKVSREAGDGKILLKNTKVDGENVDDKILPKNAKVEETIDGKFLTKSGVLKLLPKNNKVVKETSDGNLLTKNIKVVGQTSDGKILTKNNKVDQENGDDKVLKKNDMNLDTSTGKLLSGSIKKDVQSSDGYRRDKEKSSAIDEPPKQNANGEKRITEKLVSPILLRKSDPTVVGISLGQKMKQKNSKAQLKISSVGHHQPQLNPKDEENKKKRSLEHKSSPENLSKKAKSKFTDLQGTSGSTIEKHGMKKPRAGHRNKIKQKLRDQIKGILLDNGWKIDLRRRKNKDYEDSVYVSPQGTGYWSITKAYAVFQEQSKSPQDKKHRGISSKYNSLEQGVIDASCHAISKDDLAMLQRNVVKRRTKKESGASEKKHKDGVGRNSKDTPAGRSLRNKYQNSEYSLNTKHQGCALLVRGSTHNTEGDVDGYIPYRWKRTILSWMIDLGVVSEDAKVKYINKKGARARLEGQITRNGIYCRCCFNVVPVADFELHAGSKEQQPYANIFLDNGGVTLLQCLHDAWEKHSQSENKGFYKVDPGDDPDDDTCGICGDGGDLLCCDNCTSTFHLACLGINMPSGDWHCRSCICRFCGSTQEGTPSFAELLSCLQCSRKYHQVCADGTVKETVNAESSNSTNCFCSPGCRKIYKRLRKLLGLKNAIEAGFSWSLVHCFADNLAAPPKKKVQMIHCNSKTAVAFSVMDECFLPRIDERSGINIIHNVVYNCGSDFNRLNFSRFYTFILERGDEVISAASVRIHGTDLAEMPFIGTRGMYRHRGMCRLLLNAIESALCSLNVRRLVIHTTPEMQNTWTTFFGFKTVEPSKRQKNKSLNILMIHGTSPLEKRLLPTGTMNQEATAGTVNDKMDAQMLGEATGSRIPIHTSCDLPVCSDLDIKHRDNSYPLVGSSQGLTPNLPLVPEEKTPELTSPLLDDGNLHRVLRVEGSMQCMAEAENIQEMKYKETDATQIAENIDTEQKSENKSNSSRADSSAIPVEVDPCSCSSNETGKSENCPSSELPVLVRDKPEPCISGLFTNQEDKKSSAFPVDKTVSLASMVGKPDNHELKTVVSVCNIQTSVEAKDLEDNTDIANDKHIDACITKDQTFVGGVANNFVGTTEDPKDSTADLEASMARSIQLMNEIVKDENVCATKDQTFVGRVANNFVATTENRSGSAVDLGVLMEISIQQKAEVVKDKSDLPFPGLIGSSISKETLDKPVESQTTENDNMEMKDIGITVANFNEAGITVSELGVSIDICGEVMAKPNLTNGEGQRRGEDGIYKKSMEDDLASREPVNA
ncbi:hypothetical protein GUJ93_ZPchr0013g37139 [Zizania palustris]|uniref:PHD-type domain-containing protein n=1 Tax=Zizania palustris TaxID=103762 RepID=A0A8J5X5E9_ZIZPA|nr:hypothetical protein GUJ93_ZPchr0013g37139 [Zizania palustris]KAG8100578.1 hypothetical protein GUJ93_ZPchr0013g37139 [Zizania palustris]